MIIVIIIIFIFVKIIFIIILIIKFIITIIKAESRALVLTIQKEEELKRTQELEIIR